ncbi:MAG: septal ring lytic transglycosylase RlpA family protein [Flavobacterium sp.]
MKHKTTKLLLILIAVIFSTGFSFKARHFNQLQQEKTPQDTFKNKMVTVDSLGNLKNLKLLVYKKKSHASYYADKFNGRRTSSGEKFDNNKYTAAHRKFPFGTKLKVTNETNGKWVIVKVTDRGPFIKGREIDLSKRAFMDIASHKGNGAVIVTIELVVE